jgi:hypothetical protein
MADTPALVEEDRYDATLNELYEMIELARQSLEECTCEEINIPTAVTAVNYPLCAGESPILNEKIDELKELIEKTDYKEVDFSEIKNEITKLKDDFYLILEKSNAPNINNDAVLEMLNRILYAVNNIDMSDIKIDNKSRLLPLRELKIDILDELRKCCKDKNISVEIPPSREEIVVEREKDRSERSKKYDKDLHKHPRHNDCPQCGLDYGRCRCPKLVEEKIDRKILFDYAKQGERSPFHSKE